jgi:hypothetical protein
VRVRKIFAAGLCGLLLMAAAAASNNDKDKGKEKDSQVDSGSFGIFVGGQRVATETFSVRQDSAGVSTTSAQLKQEGSSTPSQTSEMKVSSGGAVVNYEWRELAPGKSELVIVPNNEFLIERVTENPGDKPKEQPFLLPNTSLILDNNFFVQREVLAWRYLASACATVSGQLKCDPAQFGAVVPQERISVRLSVTPGGPEKLMIHGAERQLVRISLKIEDSEWNLWLDPLDHFKLIRVVKTGENTEILRD